MAVFMVERRYADQLEVTADIADGINRINDEEGVRWLYSFLSADKRKTYCLYEAPSADAIRASGQARRVAGRRARRGDRHDPGGRVEGPGLTGQVSSPCAAA